MGIAASAPLRWASLAKSSGKAPAGSPDLDGCSQIHTPVEGARFFDNHDVDQHPPTLETPAPIPRSVSSGAKRCLVTQDSGPSVVPCYLLNPRLWRYNRMLTRLEWHWGMKYASLELEVEANRIYLREDLLESFDSNRWLLLPTPEMVNKIWDHCTIFLDDVKNPNQQSPIESIYEGAEVFEYRLLPLDEDFRPIERFDEPDSTGASAPPLAVSTERKPTYHSYPFDTLPTFVSSVKPHFVILDSAAKLFHQITSGPSGLNELVRLFWPISETKAVCMLCHVEYAYRTWMEHEPPLSFATTSRAPLWSPACDGYTCLPGKGHMSRRVCTGPCVRSRFSWAPSACARCLGSHRDSDGSAASDSGEDLESLSPSEREAYQRRLARYIGSWRTQCLRKVGVRGRWTSRVLNDRQLRGYPESVCG